MKSGGGIIWELSAYKWQLKGQEHNAMAHGKCVSWDTKAKLGPRIT